MQESDENGETEDLPNRLRGLQSGDEGHKGDIPEPLTHEEDEGEEEQNGQERDEGETARGGRTIGTITKSLSPGDVVRQQGIYSVCNGTSKHVSCGFYSP
jgi:hypothetical protein